MPHLVSKVYETSPSALYVCARTTGQTPGFKNPETAFWGLALIAPGDAWGPFRSNLDEAERKACLRALRQTARLLAGPRAADLCRLLARAETDPAFIEPASHALNAMAATDKRAIWASYAALSRPAA